jgi:hypothetical protein
MDIELASYVLHFRRVLFTIKLLNKCFHCLCLIGRVYLFYVGLVDKSSLYETLFHCNILSKHHRHQYYDDNDVYSNILQQKLLHNILSTRIYINFTDLNCVVTVWR